MMIVANTPAMFANRCFSIQRIRCSYPPPRAQHPLHRFSTATLKRTRHSAPRQLLVRPQQPRRHHEVSVKETIIRRAAEMIATPAHEHEVHNAPQNTAG